MGVVINRKVTMGTASPMVTGSTTRLDISGELIVLTTYKWNSKIEYRRYKLPYDKPLFNKINLLLYSSVQSKIYTQNSRFSSRLSEYQGGNKVRLIWTRNYLGVSHMQNIMVEGLNSITDWLPLKYIISPLSTGDPNPYSPEPWFISQTLKMDTWQHQTVDAITPEVIRSTDPQYRMEYCSASPIGRGLPEVDSGVLGLLRGLAGDGLGVLLGINKSLS